MLLYMKNINDLQENNFRFAKDGEYNVSEQYIKIPKGTINFVEK